MAVITDPVADLLTRIRNGIQARHQRVDMPNSKLKAEIARILKDEGYISNFKVLDEGKKRNLRIFLKYKGQGGNVISHLERVSRPGRRVYSSRGKIGRVLGGLGTNILTTPKGVMTGRSARKAGVGGEVLCNIW